MAPKKASPAKETKARRGRPTNAASAAKQTAAEERAEQEIAAESPTRETRSKISPKKPAKATPAKKAAAKTRVKTTTAKSKKPAAKPSSKAKAIGRVDYEDVEGEDEEESEVRTPVEPKQKKAAATGSKQANPFAEGAAPVLSSEISTAKKAKAPKGLSLAATKAKQRLAIERDAYEAALNGDFEAKSSIVHSDYPSVSKKVFDNQKNAGLVRGMEERIRLAKASPRPITSQKPKNTTQITRKTPDPDHADARKKAEDERIRLLAERKKIMREHQPYSTTIDTEIVKEAPFFSKRGNWKSSTNPGTIKIMIDKAKPNELQERVNPFYETLPGPEVWHRNMPPFFSFGDTKFMQQYISDEINRDLARPHPEIPPTVATTAPTSPKRLVEYVSSAASGILNAITGSPSKPAPQSNTQPAAKEPELQKTLRDDQWTLPKLTTQEKADIRRDIQRKYPDYKPPPTPSSPRKRTAHGANPPAKRTRAPHHP